MDFSLVEATRCVATCVRKLTTLAKARSTESGPCDLTPTLVLHFDGRSTLEQCFSRIVERFEASDDVFSREFLSSWVLLNVHPHVADIDINRLRGILYDAAIICGIEWNVHHIITIEDSRVAEGPHFLKSGFLYQAWRLYPDDLDAFQLAVHPRGRNGGCWECRKCILNSDLCWAGGSFTADTGDLSFKVFHSLAADGLSKNIAVPSRLYFKQTSQTPLAGLRISIKDNIKLKGVRTSHQNRSFLETYAADRESAEYVKVLLERGAVIVGKTKLGAFASAEDPPLQWIDFPCSWSPRGDSYQQPLGSTTGGTTSIVGYPWLDVSIGTDTTGSIRAPAAHNGAWAIRTSTKLAASFRGMLPNCPEFDTVGLLARSVEDLKFVAKHSFNPVIKDKFKYPPRILYNTDFWVPSPHTGPYQAIVDEFVQVLEVFLDVKKTSFSMLERWSKNPPSEAEGKSLEEYLDGTVFYQGIYDSYHEYDQFREDHERKFKRPPYVTPYLAGKWELGSKVTPDQKSAAIKEMHVFRKWIREHIMAEDAETASNAIMVLPQGTGKAWYRDEPVEIPYRGKGYQAIGMATILACPQLIIPIGQVPYYSRITDRTEYLPVSTTIVGASGSDIMLMNLAQAALMWASWPAEVETGSLTFKLGVNVRNVEDLQTPDVSPKSSAPSF